MPAGRQKILCLAPTPQLLCKLGSIIIHYEEMTGPAGHRFDKVALDGLIADPEVREWIAGMREMAMLPVKRNK